MQDWLRSAIAELTAWMPDWVKQQLGIELTTRVAAVPAPTVSADGLAEGASGNAGASGLLREVIVLPPAPTAVGGRAEVLSTGDAVGGVTRAPIVPGPTLIAIPTPQVSLPQWTGAAPVGGPSGLSTEAVSPLLPHLTVPAALTPPALSAIPIPTGPLVGSAASDDFDPGSLQMAPPLGPTNQPPGVSITIAEGAVRIALDGSADPDRLAAVIEDQLAAVARRAASEARAALHD